MAHIQLGHGLAQFLRIVFRDNQRYVESLPCLGLQQITEVNLSVQIEINQSSTHQLVNVLDHIVKKRHCRPELLLDVTQQEEGFLGVQMTASQGHFVQ